MVSFALGERPLGQRNISDKHSAYAIESNNKWKFANGSNKKLHKLLFQKDWIIENVPEYNQDKKNE